MSSDQLSFFPKKQKKVKKYKAKGSLHPKTVFDGIPCRCPDHKKYGKEIQNVG